MQTGNIFVDHGITDPEGQALKVFKIDNTRHKHPITSVVVPQDGSFVSITPNDASLVQETGGVGMCPPDTVFKINNLGDYIFEPGSLLNRGTSTVSKPTIDIHVGDGFDADYLADTVADHELRRTFEVTGTVPPNEPPVVTALTYSAPYVAD